GRPARRGAEGRDARRGRGPAVARLGRLGAVGAMTIPSWVPIREELRDEQPYGAPQIDVPVRLNTNESPYGPGAEAAADIAAAVQAAALELNRYPDREAWALREGLAAYLGHGLTADRVWAANGSNEIMQQLLQA